MPTAYELLNSSGAFDDYGYKTVHHGSPLHSFQMNNWNGLMLPNKSEPSTSSMNGILDRLPPLNQLIKADWHPDDFGHVIAMGPENMSDVQKIHFLQNFYTPPRPPMHEWPAESRMLNGKRIIRRLNPNFVERTDCQAMAYSPMYGGLFCRYCALYPPENNPQTVNASFIKRPFLRFSHMFGNGGAVKKHIHRKYHKEAKEKVEELLSRNGQKVSLTG